MGRGHRIMLVTCKVLVFRKFYFYEPFYFVKIILRGFVLQKQEEDGFWSKWKGRHSNGKRWVTFFSLEIRLSDIFLYVNLVSMK